MPLPTGHSCCSTTSERSPFSCSYDNPYAYTAKKKYRNFETNIPRKGISGSQSQFPHSCICEQFIYSHGRSPYLLEEICRPILGLYKSPTNTLMLKFGRGRAIPRKGIHKGDFCCSVGQPQSLPRSASTRFSLQSSELAPPAPLTRKRVLPPPFGSKGGTH
jgi:hypothetical protein